MPLTLVSLVPSLYADTEAIDYRMLNGWNSARQVIMKSAEALLQNQYVAGPVNALNTDVTKEHQDELETKQVHQLQLGKRYGTADCLTSCIDPVLYWLHLVDAGRRL